MHDRERVFIPHGRQPGGIGGARVDLRMVAYFGVVLMLLALAGWLYLRQASEVAGLASEIRELELEKEARHRELVTLRGEVAMLGSLKRVMNEGIEAGYILPDVSSADEFLVVRCTTNCTPPDTPAVGLAQSSGQGGVESAWSGLVRRLQSWARAELPSW